MVPDLHNVEEKRGGCAICQALTRHPQVLWLDAAHRKYIEEVGTMNMFFVLNDEVITAPLDGSILPGITRDSVIRMVKDWGLKMTERSLAIDELIEAAKDDSLQEAFGTGTAAVISPVGQVTLHTPQLMHWPSSTVMVA